FGELYYVMKISKALRFIVASILSSIIFSAVHGNLAFFIIYVVIVLIFLGLYAFTKHIWVPIVVHIMQNGFVVIIQVLVGPEKIKELQETASFIFNLII